jgi:NADPH2 dehydrogenase
MRPQPRMPSPQVSTEWRFTVPMDIYRTNSCRRLATNELTAGVEVSRTEQDFTKAVIAAVGANKTAIRLSPYSDFNGMLMDEPEPTFEYLMKKLKPLGLSYLHLIEARIKGNDDADCGGQKNVGWMVKLWDNVSPIVLAGGFLPDTAKQTASETYKDYDIIVAFGRYFVANPDLVFRVKEGVPLEKYDRAVFYTPKTPKGYVDYPFSQQYLEAIASA